MTDYRTLIVDEAHKLPEAAKQMFGKDLCMEDIREIAYYLEREHQKKRQESDGQSCMTHCMLLVKNTRLERNPGNVP